LQANKYEKILHQRADGISQNLHRALDSHRRLVTDDVMAALVEHVRSSVMYEKQLLRELEALRPDIANSASNAPIAPALNGAPRPTYIPPLEDDNAPRVRAQPPAPLIGQPHGPFAAAHAAPLPPTPVSANSSIPSVPHSPAPGPSSPAMPTGRPPMNDPPLGGRFVDGTQSMFITPSPKAPLPNATVIRTSTMPPLPPSSTTSGPPTPSSAVSPSSGNPLHSPLSGPAAFSDPLSGGPLGGSASPLGPSVSGAPQSGGLDPLGGLRPGNMSASMMAGSMRMSHQRSRLDAREAASKLANAF
jgi:hypothetical protein